jgi:competence protein ComEA
MRVPVMSMAFVLVVIAPAAAQTGGPLPDAPGKALVEQVCGTCHGLELLAPSTRTAAQWRDTLAVMKTSGAKASDEEWKAIDQYFMANLAYLNVNTATADEIGLVFDVADKIAQAVVAQRDKQGGFKTVDDLKQVPDLDQKRVEALKGRLTF